MPRWRTKIRESWPGIVDTLAHLLLGISLCASLLVFAAYRLSARDWWPLRYDLSDDGSQYLSLTAAGMRVHDIESGKEIDRITLRGPWRDMLKEPENGLFRLHPLDDANAEVFREGEWISDSSVRDSLTRPRMLLSPSRRYVLVFSPRGYLILWDRDKARAQILETPQYFLHRASINEQKQQLIVEATPRPPHSLEKVEPSPSLSWLFPSLPVDSTTVLTYRLDSLALESTVIVPAAGEPINEDRNFRCVNDARSQEFRITSWNDFPLDSPQLVHRIAYHEFPNVVNRPWQLQIRVVEGRVDLISVVDSSIWFRDYSGKYSTHRWKLPYTMQDISLDWTANGSASVIGQARGAGYTIATWGATDGSLMAYEFPDEFAAVALLPGESASRLLRAASEEGRIVDLPVGRAGEMRSQQLDLTAFPHLPLQMTCAVIVIAVFWCVYAWRCKTLFSRSGWLILMLLAIWPVIFWSIELLISRAPYGFLACSLIWISLGVVAIVSGITAFLKGDSRRALIACACALFAMLILCEIPSRQSSDQGRMTKVFYGAF